MGPEEAVQPAWPRGQPRKRRLKDPDDVGAARDPILCVREQFFSRAIVVCVCRKVLDRHTYKKKKITFLSSRLAPRPFFCKTRGDAGRPTWRETVKRKKKGDDTDGFDRIQTRINEKNKTREQAKKKVEVKERKTITGERKMWKGARACKQTCVSRTCWRRCARETYRVSLFFNHLTIVCDFRTKFSSKDLFFFVCRVRVLLWCLSRSIARQFSCSYQIDLVRFLSSRITDHHPSLISD